MAKSAVGEELRKYLNLVEENEDNKLRADILLLSDFETTVLNYVMSGNSTRSIAKNTGVSRTSVDKAIKKCSKIINQLKEKYGE